MRNLQDYEVLSVLGSGSSGTCFKVRQKESGEIFAWKAVDYDDDWTDNLLVEIELLQDLKHPNIVRHWDYVVNKETRTVYIVMEFCEGGDLAQLIERCKSDGASLSEEFVWRVLYQSCRALQTCHSRFHRGSLLHRDIKPANVFLDGQGNVKLGDFGLAKVLGRDRPFAESFVGTPYYMSPELIKGKRYNRNADVWALGCLVYEMCALKPPFRGTHIEQLSQNIAEGSFNRIPAIYSSDLQDLILFMLKVNDESRPNVDVILRHPILGAHVSCKEIAFPPFVCNQNPKVKFSPNPDFTSTALHENLSSISTPALKSELFNSVHRRLFASSNPDLAKPAEEVQRTQPITEEPSVVTQNIFNQALANRLHAIRVRESILEQKELDLVAKEKELNDRSKRLLAKEKSIVASLRRTCSRRKATKPVKLPSYEDAEDTLVPNDTIVVRTVAKMDLASFQRPKALTRKITFKSPEKFVRYNIENLPPQLQSLKTSTTSSKASDDSDKMRRIKSVFSIFSQKSEKSRGPKPEQPAPTPDPVESDGITNKWTLENKRAAFKILATMNQAENRELDRGRNRRSMIIRKSEAGNILL